MAECGVIKSIMKGKKTFTQQEADQILELIDHKIKAPREKQIAIRDKIRAIGFYYSDFTNEKRPGGYNREDFLRFVKII